MIEVLEQLFNKLDSPTRLRSEFVTPKKSETNHVEFKQKRDSRVPSLHVDDKSNFSVALSAFSNAEGGILIWGVGTTTRDNVEHARSLKPVMKVDEFAERLRTYLLDAVMPSNPLVRIKTLKNRLGNGFVICLIPPANDVPVRSMIGQREYWIRSDGRNIKLEHYQIKDMMLRHSYPDLQFNISTTNKTTAQKYIEINFSFTNTGKAIAKYCGWFIQIPNAKVHKVEDCTDASGLNQGGAYITKDLGSSVIHPNGINHRVGSVLIDRSTMSGVMLILAKWYCEDMTMKEETLYIDLEDFTDENEVSSNN